LLALTIPAYTGIVSAILLRERELFQLFLGSGITIPGKKGAHMKVHLRRDVPVGFPHRTGASSEATAAEAIGATSLGYMRDTGGHIVTVS
jgi:hypothetical protein